MSVTILDYHSGSYACSQEQLLVQYGNNAQQFCADRYEGGRKLSAGVNKIILTFTTEGGKDVGGFWLKYQGKLQMCEKCMTVTFLQHAIPLFFVELLTESASKSSKTTGNNARSVLLSLTLNLCEIRNIFLNGSFLRHGLMNDIKVPKHSPTVPDLLIIFLLQLSQLRP